jgi:hypothetical protein
MTKKTDYPPGWDEARVKRVLEHYESQSEEEALAEDEAAYEDTNQSFIEIPNELIPEVRELIAKKSRIQCLLPSAMPKPPMGEGRYALLLIIRHSVARSTGHSAGSRP